MIEGLIIAAIILALLGVGLGVWRLLGGRGATLRRAAVLALVLAPLVLAGCAQPADNLGVLDVDVVVDERPSTRLTATEVREASPVWSPDSRQIAYTIYQNDNWDIWIMDRDGTNQRNLTNSATNELHLAWSPDGSQIAFQLWEGEGRYDIGLLALVDGSLTNLTSSEANETRPVWSPDGERIAFWTPSGIQVMDAAGGRQVSLTQGMGDSLPAWSPDGERIAYVSETLLSGWDIYVKTVGGLGSRRLTHDSYKIVEGDPIWSPDGSRILFTNTQLLGLDGQAIGETKTDIYLIDLEENTIVNLTGSTRSPQPDPVWSPDGERIAYVSFQGDEFFDDMDIFVLDPASGQIVRITDSAQDEGALSWSPDGAQIAYTATGDIYVVDVRDH